MGVEMNMNRRSFLGVLAVALSAGPALLIAQRPPETPFPRPQAPEPPARPNERELLKANQKDLKRDVQRLLELAQDLQKEIEKTDSSAVLSVSVVRKAEEIERLAKHIKALARG